MITRLGLAITLLCTPALQAASRHAAVIDDRAIRLVDLTRNTPVQTLRLPEGSQHVVFSQDQTRLVVFSVPAAANATATFVDAPTFAHLGTIELGTGINDVMPYGDHRLYVLTHGTPAELWDLDFTTGKAVQHLVFDRDAAELDLMPDGVTAMVYMAGDAKQGRAAEMRFVDRASFAQSSAVKLTPGAGAPVAFPDGKYFYAIDPAGKVFVLSTVDHTIVGSLDVAQDAKIAAIQTATNRIFVTSHSANVEGYLHVFRNEQPEKTIKVDFEPMFLDLAADMKSGTVSGRSFRGVAGIHSMRKATLDLSDLAPATEQATQLRTLGSAEQQAVNQFTRALGRCCNDVTMEHTMRIADRIGRTGEVIEGSRSGSVLAAGAVIAGIVTSLHSQERIPAHVSEPKVFTDYYESPVGATVDAGRSFVRGDNQFAYEIDNHEHLFVTRTADRRRVAKIAVDDGLQEMVVLGGDRTLAVVGDDRVAIIDMEKNVRTDYFKAGGDVLGVAVSPDMNFGAVIGEDKVSIVDGGEGRVTFAFGDIRGRAQVVFLP